MQMAPIMEQESSRRMSAPLEPPLWQVTFHFNSTKRRRMMPFIPRKGEHVVLDDGDETVYLQIGSVHYADDCDTPNGWLVWTNCDVTRID